MKGPIIGITTSFEGGAQHLDVRYIDAVMAAGGIPRILPAVKSSEWAQLAAEGVQGLMIPGGPAIETGLVGELPADIDPTDPRRHASDRWYLELFAARPVLGICYGMQLINAVAGGTIYADVQNQLAGASPHSSKRGGMPHLIQPESESLLERLIGGGPVEVNTYHLQALETAGDGLQVSARAADGVIEAIESADARVLAVQFHPERQLDDMLPLFTHLVESAKGAAPLGAL